MCKASLVVAVTLCMSTVGCSTLTPKRFYHGPTWSSSASLSHQTIHGFFSPQRSRLWNGVDPELRRKVEAIQVVMSTEGYDLRPMEGYRSPQRQAALLASASGVTSVGAWSSCHNYGLAADVAVFINGKPSWDTDDPYVLAGYQRFGEFAEALGLNWGGRWRSPVDYPHVEMASACSAAKVARRRGREIPAFAAPSSISPLQALKRHLAPTWCPKGTEWACNADRWIAIAWNVPEAQVSARVCRASAMPALSAQRRDA